MDYAWLAVPIDTKWEAGYKYVYTLDFTNGAGYSDPLDGPETGGTVLGGAIKFTMEVNPWGEKATMEATKNMLIGTWDLIRIENKEFDLDGNWDLQLMDTQEEARDWHGSMWWTFTVKSETEYLLYPGTEYEESCNYELVDNHLFVDKLFNEVTQQYECDMFIRDITENLVTFLEIRYWSDGTHRETIYYYARIQ